jgi:hypothetical protein
MSGGINQTVMSVPLCGFMHADDWRTCNLHVLQVPLNLLKNKVPFLDCFATK